MSDGNGKRVNDLLESYGADRRRWPKGEGDWSVDPTSRIESEARAIDRVLDLASIPVPPDQAVERLLSRLEPETPAQIVQFRPRPAEQRQPFFRYAAVPLAASLALGVYLGAQGTLDFALPESLVGALAQTEEPADDLGGVGEADAYFAEGLT